ncbi:hypothetical protein [Frigoriflavimonas asaccharolytica]|uniref:TonB C-terminal domain-containing protein n=1 Tax=Frigoriflavimonas asaccharolytica TaxID=2735899 RepID=A0A8J8K718_9FLAO|nr:hypothetical protein [Frigoriflavimonas asaccharolytica]NRS91051.1 hypothetical protein [Frigoriflavimonas asaccharolytica]
MRDSISKNFNSKNVKELGKISCQFSFVIEKDGIFTDVKSIGKNESFNREIIRTIKGINVKWIPAQKDGRIVKYLFICPLTMFLR